MSLDIGKENEGRLIGCILCGPEILLAIRLQITADHFQFARYRATYQIIEALADEGQAIDELSIHGRADALGKLETSCGISDLLELAAQVTGPSGWAVYAERMRDADRRRRMVVILREASGEIAQGADTGAVALRVSGKLQQIAGDGSGGARSMSEIAAEVFREIRDAADNPEARTSIPTRIASIDLTAGEMLPGELVIIAGRPSVGKTAILMSILRASRQAALLISAEMTGRQIVLREVSAGTGITYQDLCAGHINERQWPAIVEAHGRIASQPLDVIDDGRVRIERIAEEAYRAKHRRGISVLAVDYLQLVSTSRRYERRDLEVGEITASLKGIAKDLGIVVLAACQVGREAEKGTSHDRRPRLHHLRESGNIEQDADRVYGIYRHAKYSTKMPEHLMRITEIGIEKNRFGPTGRAFMDFHAETASFMSADRVMVDEYLSYIASEHG